MASKIIVKHHPREKYDLQEFFSILTKQCNGNCAFCTKCQGNAGSFINKRNFISGVEFVKEHGLNNFFLHGGEPTLHPDLVEYVYIVKGYGLVEKMFTNGLDFCKLKQVDGLVDEIKILYRNENSLQFIQSEWKSRLSLEIMATEKNFPTLATLIDFIKHVREMTGMEVYVNTLNPINQGAYDLQYVSYLEELFLSLSIDEIFCIDNKAAFLLPDGTKARLGNKLLNSNHVKYNMTPDGVIHDRFESDFKVIKHNHELDEKLALANDRLKKLKTF